MSQTRYENYVKLETLVLTSLKTGGRLSGSEQRELGCFNKITANRLSEIDLPAQRQQNILCQKLIETPDIEWLLAAEIGREGEYWSLQEQNMSKTIRLKHNLYDALY